MSTGLIFDIKRYSVHDGPGIRTTVFLKGCPLTCWWCHNPESRDPAPVLHFDAERCLGCHACVAACPEGAAIALEGSSSTDLDRCVVAGACAEACPSEARQIVGRRYTPEEVVAEVVRDRVFFDESGGGVTFSGGEPLLQWSFLLETLELCGRQGLHRAVDTTGASSPDVLMKVARHTDLFLYDLKVMDPARHREVTGTPLRTITNNLVRLLSAGARVWIRIPLVPGVSDGDNLDHAATFLEGLDGVEAVHLLPFHPPARDKHRRFGVDWRLPDDLALPDGYAEEAAHRLRRHGLNVVVGG